VQDPILQTLLRGCFEELEEVARCKIGHEGHAGAGDGLVDEEAADGGGEETEGVELGEAVVDFEGCEAEEGRDDARSAGLARVGGVLEFGAEEGGDVGAGLADDEVVHVEEFGDAAEGGVALVGGVGCCLPGLEGEAGVFGGGGGVEPGDYAAGFVFAEEGVRGGGAGGGGCVGGDGGGPDEDVGRCEVVEEIGDAAAAGGGDGDVEDTFRARVGFFEGEFPYIGTDAFFEDVHVEEVALSNESPESAQDGLSLSCLLLGQHQCVCLFSTHGFMVVIGESRQVNPVPIQEIQ